MSSNKKYTNYTEIHNQIQRAKHDARYYNRQNVSTNYHLQNQINQSYNHIHNRQPHHNHEELYSPLLARVDYRQSQTDQTPLYDSFRRTHYSPQNRPIQRIVQSPQIIRSRPISPQYPRHENIVYRNLQRQNQYSPRQKQIYKAFKYDYLNKSMQPQIVHDVEYIPVVDYQRVPIDDEYYYNCMRNNQNFYNTGTSDFSNQKGVYLQQTSDKLKGHKSTYYRPKKVFFK